MHDYLPVAIVIFLILVVIYGWEFYQDLYWLGQNPFNYIKVHEYKFNEYVSLSRYLGVSVFTSLLLLTLSKVVPRRS